MNYRKVKSIIAVVFIFGTVLINTALAQKVTVDVNLNTKHTLGDISTFNRKKFVVIHSDISDNEWDGNNFTSDLRNDFLNGYDVYLGRNTGGISWNLDHVVSEDPARPGYADPAAITSSGQSIKTSYANNPKYFAYESRNGQILCTQLHPFWPDGQQTKKGWSFSQTDTPTEPFGTASGEYMGRFIRDAYGTGGITGQALPEFVEVVNEPLYWLVDHGINTPEQVFKFHNVVASQIRKYSPNPNIKIGGYCAAFPDLDKNNFQEWTNRWKLFMDICGANMDFWTIHLYDFPAIGGKQKYRKGSNMEATFDMMEEYSYLKFGIVKPFVISEFGASSHDLDGPWSPLRDWYQMKSVNSMMMQFMERANVIDKAVNYLMLKQEWWVDGVNTSSSRLMRRENEPTSYTGKYVYTEQVKTYQLWSDVKGTRVDAKSSNPDIMTDSYVNENKAFVILNNLNFVPVELKLNVLGSNQNLQSVKVKHLHRVGDKPVLDEEILSSAPDSISIDAEGTIILEYSYNNAIIIDQTSEEVKHYATTYFRPINANTPEIFTINNVDKGVFGEANLRIGIGRTHGKSLHPKVIFNGQEIEVPTNFRGDDQLQKETFFGVLEIPVPYSLLQTNNAISVEFPDGGGYISSVTLRAYKFSKAIKRSGNTAVTGISLSKDSLRVGIGQSRYLSTTVFPENATVKNVVWFSADTTVATVDENTGAIMGKKVGEVQITATTVDGEFSDSCLVIVQNDFVSIPVETVELSSSSISLIEGTTYQLIATIRPVDATNKNTVWQSSNPNIATVDENGLVTSISEGFTEISIRAENGNKIATCNLTVLANVAASIAFDNESYYTGSTYQTGGEMQVNCTFHAGTGNTVTDGDNGVKFWLRELKKDWSVINDYIAFDESAIGKESGSASATISLKGATATKDLPEGNFYFLFISFKTSDGESYNKGIWPIKVENQTSVGQTIEKDYFKIYPNRVNTTLSVEWNDHNKYNQYQILNENGQMIMKDNLNPELKKLSIDVSLLQQGLYLLKFIGSQSEIQKFIKLN